MNCTLQVPGALFAANDQEGVLTLTVGVISLNGIEPPAPLVSCVFNGFSANPPTASQLPLTIVDATDVFGNPISASVGVVVQ